MTYQPHKKSLMAESGDEPPPRFGVRLHQQEDLGGEQFCGAASAQMLLESIGAGLLDQGILFNECNACSAGDPGKDWFSAPDGLTCTLNQHRPQGYPGSFRLWELQSEVDASRMICWAIENGVAPIASVFGGRHWIVVVGFESSRAPENSTDPGYQIIKFEVFDPEDGTQAKTIYYNEESATPLSKKQYWTRNFMNVIETGFWKGKYLVVCDPNPLGTI
jgi:hypothetical protein